MHSFTPAIERSSEAGLKILLCGSRYWEQGSVIEHVLSHLHLKYGVELLVHGACTGADLLGAKFAGQIGIPVKDYPAGRTKLGKPAGPIRNRKMLHEAKPDVVIAFHDYVEGSKGTRDMIDAAFDAGVTVWVVDSLGKTEVYTPTRPKQKRP